MQQQHRPGFVAALHRQLSLHILERQALRPTVVIQLHQLAHRQPILFNPIDLQVNQIDQRQDVISRQGHVDDFLCFSYFSLFQFP
jgi:hypothetical protein